MTIFAGNKNNNFGNYREANGIKPLFPILSEKEKYKAFIICLRKFYEYDIMEK